jgi:hypothetical protein
MQLGTKMALGVGEYIKFPFSLSHRNGIFEVKRGGVRFAEFFQSVKSKISFGLAIQY